MRKLVLFVVSVTIFMLSASMTIAEPSAVIFKNATHDITINNLRLESSLGEQATEPFDLDPVDLIKQKEFNGNLESNYLVKALYGGNLVTIKSRYDHEEQIAITFYNNQDEYAAIAITGSDDDGLYGMCESAQGATCTYL